MSWLRAHPAVSVWQYRARAAGWVLIGWWSVATDHADSVVLVWIASLYANVATDLGGAAAADDRELIERLDRLEGRLDDVEACLDRIEHLLTRPGGDDR